MATSIPPMDLTTYDPQDTFNFSPYNDNLQKISNYVDGMNTSLLSKIYNTTLSDSGWAADSSYWRQTTAVRVDDGDIVEIINVPPTTVAQLSDLGIQLIVENTSGTVSVIAIGGQPNMNITCSFVSYKVVNG